MMKNRAISVLAVLAVVGGLFAVSWMAGSGQIPELAERVSQDLNGEDDGDPTPSLSKDESEKENLSEKSEKENADATLTTDSDSILEKIALEALKSGQKYRIRYRAEIYDAKKSLDSPAHVVETAKWVTGNGSAQTTEIACPLPSELKGKNHSETIRIDGQEARRYRFITSWTAEREEQA